MNVDLFGQPLAEAELLQKPQRRPRTGRPWRGGYAAYPGTGPKGEKCKSCAYAVRVQGGANSYTKCKLMEFVWTHGAGSDIKLKTAACSRWPPSLTEEVDL
jgi:hypothetical protein